MLMKHTMERTFIISGSRPKQSVMVVTLITLATLHREMHLAGSEDIKHSDSLFVTAGRGPSFFSNQLSRPRHDRAELRIPFFEKMPTNASRLDPPEFPWSWRTRAFNTSLLPKLILCSCLSKLPSCDIFPQADVVLYFSRNWLSSYSSSAVIS